MFGRKKINELQSLINASRTALERAEQKAEELSVKLNDAKTKIEERDKLIAKQADKILDQAKKLDKKDKEFKAIKKKMQGEIDDLNTNIEFLFNNLSPKKKAALRPDEK